MLKDNPHKGVIYWLLSGCALIYIMVVVGCITRLTHSGLSITDWSVMGTMPPLSDESWSEHFGRYQLSPEYRIINSGMTLDEFKNIFWWEWTHRMLGRMIGLVFFAGFMWFLIRRKLDRRLLIKCLVLFGVGALQGLVGWWMVKSGLSKDPHVSHYRLATHLMTAFTAFAFSFWFALQLIYEHRGEYRAQDERRRLFWPALITFVVLLVQVVYGAFVAGLKAGLYCPTWPKMCGEWFPEEIIMVKEGALANFAEVGAGVQFVHRTFAWVLVMFILYLWRRSNKLLLNKWQQQAVSAIIYLTTLQIMLGIFTLLYSVPVVLGVLHQSVAFFLFAAFLYLLFHLRSPKPIHQ